MKATQIFSTLVAAGLMAVSGSAFAADAAKVAPTGTYNIDPVHSKVGFEIGHLVISTVEGKFNQFTGDIVAGKKPEATKTNVEIQTASIDTANADRDKHLKSPDFFDAEKFPKMTFKSDKAVFNGSDVEIPGQLTIKGVTKPVTLKGKFLGTVKGMMGEERLAAQLGTKINRKDFGLTWNKAIEAGPVVGDEVTISLRIEAVKKK
ncbi:MAG: YceI family protein [Bdellovibrionia bacterium]